jgi:hypothetical protein
VKYKYESSNFHVLYYFILLLLSNATLEYAISKALEVPYKLEFKETHPFCSVVRMLS